jgi:hypothetical protein
LRMYGPGTMSMDMKRRSIYFFIKRSKLIPVMMAFDWPEHLVSIGARSRTTVAPQALAFLNSPQVRTYAEGLARRASENATSTADKIKRAYRLALSRAPRTAESAAARTFIKRQVANRKQRGDRAADQDAFADFCQALLSVNEFAPLE